MMRAILALSTAAGLAVMCGAADKSNLAPAFKNTVVSTYPDGRQAKLWLSSDGTYRAQGRKGDASDGTWKLKGDQICMKQKHPFSPPIGYCTAIPSGGVGSTWAAKSVFGDPLKVRLVAGRG
jgi:hypothetical protein